MSKDLPRVLIIDDNADILELYTILLAHKNYQVLGKNSGEEIVQVIRDFSPHVIILDMLLSGLDGLTVCKQLKENSSTTKIPIIMVSAHASGREKSAEARADFFVAKPFEMSEFLDTISRAVQLGTRQ